MWKGGGTTSAKGGYDEELGKWQAWHGGGTLCACACAWTWAYMHGEDTHGHRVGLTWDKDYA